MGWKLKSLFEIWYLSFFLNALSPLPFKIFCNISLITLVYLPHQFSKCLLSFLITIYLRYYMMTFNEIMHNWFIISQLLLHILVFNCPYIIALFETLPTMMFCCGIFYLMGRLVYNISRSSFQIPNNLFNATCLRKMLVYNIFSIHIHP